MESKYIEVKNPLISEEKFSLNLLAITYPLMNEFNLQKEDCPNSLQLSHMPVPFKQCMSEENIYIYFITSKAAYNVHIST